MLGRKLYLAFVTLLSGVGGTIIFYRAVTLPIDAYSVPELMMGLALIGSSVGLIRSRKHILREESYR